jgi:hypothetical protein
MTLGFADKAVFIAAVRLILEHYEDGKVESFSALADADKILRVGAVYYAGYADEVNLPGIPVAIDPEGDTEPGKGQK